MAHGRKMNVTAVVLACAVPLSACTTTHFYGEYHPASGRYPSAGRQAKGIGQQGVDTAKDVMGSRQQQPVLATGNSFHFLWGTLNTGSVDVDDLISSSLKDKALTNVAVEDRISLLGVVCWVLTAGIFSHHSIIVRGDVVPETPPAPQRTPAPAPSPTGNP